MGALLRALGLLLLFVPFLPLARLFPRTPGGSGLVAPSEWFLGLFIAGALAWLAALLLQQRVFNVHRWAGVPDRIPGWITGLLLVALASILVLVSWEVFRHRPLLVDSIAQMFQAAILMAGRAVAPLPPEGGFFTAQQMVEGSRGWYAQYPPGHPFLLAVGVALKLPWAVPILLSLGSALFLYLFAREAYDSATATLTLVLVLLSPFFWFMGASFMNHVSALFFTCLALYLLARWGNSGSAAALAAAAACIGAMFLIRPLDAVAVGTVLGAWAAWRCLRAGRPATLAPAALAGLAVAGLYLVWNAATTGHPLAPGYIELWGSAHGLGFHESPWGEAHTPLTGLRNQLTDLALLNLFLFEWPVPALLPVALYFALGWNEGRWDRLLLVGAVAVPAAYFFYWHRDAYLGPRFLYGTLAFFLPLTARAILTGFRRLRGREWGAGGLRVEARAFLLAFLLLCFGYTVFYGAPQRFRVYATGMSSMKVDVAAEARAAGIEEGLVFVGVNWGNRLLAGLRARGVPAADLERAYRRVDHCDLQHILTAARQNGWAAYRVMEEVRRLEAGTDPGRLATTDALNQDPSLRLRVDRPLAEACLEEIRYDQGGYTIYAPHLLANRPRLDGPLVVARDLRSENFRLARHYPDLPAYLWRGGSFEPLRLPRVDTLIVPHSALDSAEHGG